MFSIERDGFSILPDVLSGSEIDFVTVELSSRAAGRSRAGIRHLLSQPVVSNIAHSAPFLAAARQVLGPHAFPFTATLFSKTEAANWLIVWHQDTALPIRQKCEMQGWGPWSVKDGFVYAHAPAHALQQVLALRIHLDDCFEDDGPLRVLPGTHKQGVLTDDEVQRLSRELSPVDCVLPRGGVLAMRPLLVHASSKSRTRRPRRVLHIEYAGSLTTSDGLELAAA